MTADGLPRVLVADDQSDVLLALRLLLRDEGLQVDAAASAQEVRSRLHTAEYDLLLMDLNYARDTTSGAEGLELLRDVRAHDPLLPILVMTGWGTIDTAVEAMRRGACGFVHKPWDNGALTAAVRREVEHGRASRSSHRRAVRERSEAQAIQRALLPVDMPDVPGCAIGARWKPAATFGGDLYDVSPLPGRRVAISIGDVCGKGLPAALLMANVQAALRASAALDPSPRSIIDRLNRDLAGNAALRRFVTLFVAVYDQSAQRLTYCNAGHNAPVVVRSDGSMARLDVGGTVVGAFDHSAYDEGRIDLARGDHIVLFTDGIIEADAGGRHFGDEGLLNVLRRQCGQLTATALVDAIFDAAGASTSGEFDDDATVVVAGIR